MNTYKVTLIPHGSITKFPDSQTIFGSICWAIRDLYGEETLEDILDNFYTHQNKFIVSSVFPDGLVKAPNEIWSNPKEVNEILNSTDIDGGIISKKLKMLKKAEYITLDLLKELLLGRVDKKEFFQSTVLMDGSGRYKLIDEKILALSEEEIKGLSIKYDKGRRNSINRIQGSTMEGNLYYYNRIFLDKNIKLYFFIKTKNIDFFRPVFRYLSDAGIGSDKSTGINSYEVDIEGHFLYEKRVDFNYLLSKYIPYYDEVDWKKSSYKIEFGNYKVESRFEFMGEDIIKNEVGYILEGSKIVLKEKKEIYGRLPIIKEIKGKKIRQNGLGFFL